MHLSTLCLDNQDFRSSANFSLKSAFLSPYALHVSVLRKLQTSQFYKKCLKLEGLIARQHPQPFPLSLWQFFPRNKFITCGTLLFVENSTVKEDKGKLFCIVCNFVLVHI